MLMFEISNGFIKKWIFLYLYRTFIFPPIDGNPNCLRTASFQHIEEVYRLESTMSVRMAFKLNDRVINPSSIERQSVSLTLAVFDESTINALNFYGQNGHPEFLHTAEFLLIVLNWWKTVNLKSQFLAKRKRDPFREPITKENLVSKTSFLRSFVDWLDVWERASDSCHRGLSKETFHVSICFRNSRW